MSIDFSKIGLKVGLELHQQLDTAEKLFCSCKPQLFKAEPETTFLRRLRPTQSELGQIDPAAFFEFQKGTKIVYEANKETACLVEMDEEPPHGLNTEAVEIALIVALTLNATPIDEIHVMRKTVIDGSNTTGFQRTCAVALNGEIRVDGKKIPIQHIGIEEDASRKMGEDGSVIRYRIDRLGIPDIEVATAPVLYSPKEAEKVALAIGKILRATGRVKRGLGTIRQDLNVSIPDGAVIEIKGVQELELVSKIIRYEVQRQRNLLEIRDELHKRGVNEKDIKEDFIDATSVFIETKCGVVQRAVSNGKAVLAVLLPKFAGLLKIELMPGVRLGTEMASRAHFWGRVGGIFHTDELPAYGITKQEVIQLREIMKAEPKDAVVFVADKLENASDALKAVAERARESLRGVPEETRGPNPDGTTRYMRPRPGAARMYPETDVPPLQISEEYLNDLQKHLPELPEHSLERLMKEHKLNKKLARQVLDSEYAMLFEEVARRSNVSPTTIAAVLTETMKALGRDGVEIDKIRDEQIRELFGFVGSGKTAKEAIPEILTWLSKHENSTIAQAVQSLGLTMLSEVEIGEIIDKLIGQNRRLVKERGKTAFGVFMGLAMKKIRGKADADLVSKVLRRKLEESADKS